MTKFAIAFLFALLAVAPMLIAQAESSDTREGGHWRESLRRARQRLNARAGRLGRDFMRAFQPEPELRRSPVYHERRRYPRH